MLGQCMQAMGVEFRRIPPHKRTNVTESGHCRGSGGRKLNTATFCGEMSCEMRREVWEYLGSAPRAKALANWRALAANTVLPFTTSLMLGQAYRRTCVK